MVVVPSPGDRLGHYLISEPLGAGGMGEVYRAQDTRLGREVAIKVLPEAVASDPERLARFEREAKVLASLNHPNIATLYGLESAEAGTVFLAMELIEGDDLSERIKKGPVLPREAIAIGRQIAEGLEAAHNNGIVHRDLKPANIRITPEGTVKILDFGLAKEWGSSPGDLNFTESPTLTAEMTRAGTILGTAPYLSPEQARGQAVDRRTDIWAFGFWGDIGGFGIGNAAQFSWQAQAEFGFRVSKLVTIFGGYRVLDFDTIEGQGLGRNGVHLRQNGPMIGAGIRL